LTQADNFIADYIQDPFRQFITSLINSLKAAMQKNLDCFVHRLSLWAVADMEIAGLPNGDLIRLDSNSSHFFCLSRITRNAKQVFVALQPCEGQEISAQEQKSELLDLDFYLKGSIHPDYVEWVLTSLLVFAYSKQHPVVPKEQSSETREALNAYYTLINHLRPHSTTQDASIFED